MADQTDNTGCIECTGENHQVLIYLLENRIKHFLDEKTFLDKLVISEDFVDEREKKKSKHRRRNNVKSDPLKHDKLIVISRSDLELDARVCTIGKTVYIFSYQLYVC